MQEDKVNPTTAKWGFQKWNDKGIIINARAETLSEKMMFKNLVKYNRCIVPASGFYEWDKFASREKPKNNYYFKNPGSILYMAGLYNTYHTKSEMESWLQGENVNTLLSGNKAKLTHTIIS